MKSAYELAMERLGGGIQELSDEQKSKIADIESKAKAKIAEAEIAKDKRLAEAYGDSMQSEQVLKDYAVEIASINSQCEAEKEKIRQGK